jgi:hypothetical protein
MTLRQRGKLLVWVRVYDAFDGVLSTAVAALPVVILLARNCVE